MNKRFDVDKSYGLEEQIAKSVERFRDNANKTRNLKRQILNILRARKQVGEIPQEIIDWFRDTEDEDEEDD